MQKSIFLLLTIVLAGCSTGSKIHLAEFRPGPDLIIYKTAGNYDQLVPVTLSADKKQLTGFPHPQDLHVNQNPTLPTKLIRGYLLDNRGIGPNVAFTSFTYPDYMQLTGPPPIREIMASLTDTDPITEMYNCGPRQQFKNIHQVNQLIRNNFRGASKIK